MLNIAAHSMCTNHNQLIFARFVAWCKWCCPQGASIKSLCCDSNKAVLAQLRTDPPLEPIKLELAQTLALVQVMTVLGQVATFPHVQLTNLCNCRRQLHH